MIEVPELVNAFIQYWIAKELLEAQKDARERLGAIAQAAMEKAKEHFAEFMTLRDYDQIVYDKIKEELPDKEICQTEIDRGTITGRFQQADIIRQTAFGYSRYNCGARESAIMDALSAAIIASGEMTVTAYNHEEALQDIYKAHRLTTLSTSGSFGEFNAARAFGSVAEYMTNLDAALTSAAGSSLFGLGYSLKNIYNQAFRGGHTDGAGDAGGGIGATRRGNAGDGTRGPAPIRNPFENVITPQQQPTRTNTIEFGR